MTLTAAQLDRACGVLLGTAAGDSLGAGPRGWTPPKRHSLRTSQTMGGLSRRYRLHGRQSPQRPSRRMIQLPASSASTTCAKPWTRRCAAATTPTPSRQSRADCWALSTGRPRFPRNGVACCTAGLGFEPET
jgi:hypothetical protein